MPTSPFNHDQMNKPMMIKKPPQKAVAFFDGSDEDDDKDSFVKQTPAPIIQKQLPPPVITPPV